MTDLNMSNLANNLSKLLAKANTIRREAAMVVVEELIMPWYETQGGEPKASPYELRNRVAHTVHEALAGLIWFPRDYPSITEAEYMVHAVEPFQSEDGGYTLMVTIRHKDFIRRPESEPVDKSEEIELPLHAFLQGFEPVGQVEFHDYHS